MNSVGPDTAGFSHTCSQCENCEGLDNENSESHAVFTLTFLLDIS